MIEENEYPIIHPLRGFQEGRNFINLVSGKGIYVKDSMGKVYIDAISGLWNLSLGYGNRKIKQAIVNQLEQLPFVNLYSNTNSRDIELAEMLLKITKHHFEKVIFTCTGSECLEVAVKAARKYYRLNGYENKYKFWVFDISYHGTTYAAMSASGIDGQVWQNYSPLVGGFECIKVTRNFICHNIGEKFEAEIRQLEGLFEERSSEFAGIIIEPIIGSGGIISIPEVYIKKIQELCLKYDVLFICDEVATGFGRTGKLFSIENVDVKPDIFCLSKGIDSGYLPLGAVLIDKKITRVFTRKNQHIDHLSTQNGNPVACAAGTAAIEQLNEELIKQVDALGNYFIRRLKEVFIDKSMVKQIRGRGLMIGIELFNFNGTVGENEYKMLMAVIRKIEKRGMLVYPFFVKGLTAGITLMPPLIITKDEIDKALEILLKVINGIKIKSFIAVDNSTTL